ncbi:MAG TPA: hypothetical protein VFA49_14715 [Chloroflexota bacterium]|jgi:hypothetical protein|nr:hypothetical protein [Chloroflexota bacterium]
MANDQTEAQRAAQAAIDEAARTVAEASRRTTERAQQAARTLLDQSTEINRTLFSAWVNSAESLWRTAFEIQNAQLRAGLSWWQTVADSSRAAVQMLEQWDAVGRQAQQAGLEAFHASARTLASTVEQGASAAEPAARSGR